MNRIFVARYLYKRRFYYLFTVYVYIAAYSCGIFTAAKKFEIESMILTVFGSMLNCCIPVAVMCFGGLFFAGNIFVIAGLCCTAYRMGYRLCISFMLSFASGSAYLFFVGVPVGILYFVCGIFSAASAFECNISRFEIRKKGLARPMNNYEMNNYIAKCCIALGTAILTCVLEYNVFMAAYIKLIM